MKEAFPLHRAYDRIRFPSSQRENSLAGLLFVVRSYQEYRNRVPFGNHLTVSKVAPAQDYVPRTLFPDELTNERFVGELHFKGNWKLRYSPEENAVTVMRAGLQDLQVLAVAVENNDPRLSDFKYFVGLSSMVSPLLERFGFKVVYYKDQLGLPALGQPDQKDIKLQMRPVMAVLFDKETLVAAKEKLAKSAR